MRRGPKIVAWIAGIVAVLIVASPLAYQALFPVPKHYDSDLEHFKFGSVGVEAARGVPYEVWRTLPGICMSAEDREKGYAKFGFLWEEGHPTPIGMPVETALVPRVGINCAMCHVGRVEGPDGKLETLAGAPNTSLDLQDYLRFLFSCVGSNHFTADAVLAENARVGGSFGLLDRFVYRYLVIPQMKNEIAGQARQMSFMEGQTDWGPGRAPGFQPVKIQVLGIPFDGTLDIVDIPSLWAMEERDGQGLHWDGRDGARAVGTTIWRVRLAGEPSGSTRHPWRNGSATGRRAGRSTCRASRGTRPGRGRCRRRPIPSRSTGGWRLRASRSSMPNAPPVMH